MINKQSILQIVSAVTKSRRGVRQSAFPNAERDWFLLVSVIVITLLSGVVIVGVQYLTGNLSHSVEVEVIAPTVTVYAAQDAEDLAEFFEVKEATYNTRTQSAAFSASQATTSEEMSEEVAGE